MRNKLTGIICGLVSAVWIALTAAGASAGGAGVQVGSGAERSAPCVSVNDCFSVGGGAERFNLIMCGLKEQQKDPVLSALSRAYDPESPEPLKLVDDAFTDAEKYDSDDLGEQSDSGLCWAAAVSNMLWMSGWAGNYANPQNGRPFTSEDEVFDYYWSRFTNFGVDNIPGAVDWFFMGEFYNLTYSRGASLYEEDSGDGLQKDFVSSLIQEYTDLTGDPGGIEVLLLCDWNREGASVFQAGIGCLLEGALESSEHSVTVAGVITDPAAASWEEAYRAILIIDSDNDAKPDAADSADPDREERLARRAARPNSVTVYPLKFTEDVNHTPYWQVTGYGKETDEIWALYDISRLRIFDPALPAQFAETEGSKDVHTDVDLTLEGLFTTDRQEAIADMFGIEEEEVIVNEFASGDSVNLNFFIANRSEGDFDDAAKREGELAVEWTVLREKDGIAAASGRKICEEGILHGIEQGYMIRLNDQDGVPQAWESGFYTVTLDLNTDRGIREAYYLNNLRKTYRFEIR